MDDIRISAVEVAGAPEATLRTLHGIATTLRAEAWPDDGIQPFEMFRRQLEAAPPFRHTGRWLAWRGDDAVGYARSDFRDGTDNQHAISGYVGVLPEERRRRLGSELLKRIVATARSEGKRLLLIESDSFVPAGAAFIERLGGRHGITETISALQLGDLDRATIHRWLAEGQQQAGEYELLDWRDAVPEESIEAYIDLVHVMNTAPTEDLDIEDFVLTPEQLRHYDAARAQIGERRWTRIARHRASGDFAGFTELFWNPSDPNILHQGGTGVYPAHRGHGLGRWLKAANLLGALDDIPDATWVRTGNAGTNEHMLAINRAMGFKEYKEVTGWQFDVGELEGKLLEEG